MIVLSPRQTAQTLAGLKIGADEPNRQVGARRQLEARAAHGLNAYSDLQRRSILPTGSPPP